MSGDSWATGAAKAEIAGFLEEAKAEIDDAFGAGHAKKNPALVGAYLQACAIVFHGERVVDGFDRHAEAVRYVESAIRESGCGELSVTVHGLASGLSKIAESIAEAGKR